MTTLASIRRRKSSSSASRGSTLYLGIEHQAWLVPGRDGKGRTIPGDGNDGGDIEAFPIELHPSKPLDVGQSLVCMVYEG